VAELIEERRGEQPLGLIIGRSAEEEEVQTEFKIVS